MEVAIERPGDRSDEFRVRKDQVRFLDVPEHRFVMIDGQGPPAQEAFEARLPGLYTTAYGVRFACKRRGLDEKVGPLEGRWWTTDHATYHEVLADPDRSSWRWVLMIGLPDGATDDEVAEHLEAGRAKLGSPFAPGLRIASFHEGPAAQLLHLGPYDQEGPSIDRLSDSIAEAGLRPRGEHHELYLGDPRRAAPEKLRTVLRQPVQA
jgi:hypothetical protein